MNSETSVGIVGLGYVGLPLAVAFGRKFPTVGYDLSVEKIKAYRDRHDPTGEVSSAVFGEARMLDCTNDPSKLNKAQFIIVAVPTPVDGAHMPDFGPLRSASETVGKSMGRGATVIFESTVYPGATEEVCVPIIERASGR
jgi:UDP-N-acetyl-D-galactosamine dehydrogenase